jgi:hypothetical protein
MDPKTSHPRAPAGEQKEKPIPHPGQGASPSPTDAESPASKPQGTLHDQVKTMESEGQAQPQADEVPPEERASQGIAPLPEPDVQDGEEHTSAGGDAHGPNPRARADNATGS